MDRARIISELARFGSIDALIAAHGSLTAEDVSSVLRYASDLVAAEEAPAFETSPLYRAYNGFMLGLFFAGSLVFKVRDEVDRRRAALARLLEFLFEFRHEFGKELPPFDLDAEDLEDAVDASVRELDPELATFYQLGLTTFRYVVLSAGTEDA